MGQPTYLMKGMHLLSSHPEVQLWHLLRHKISGFCCVVQHLQTHSSRQNSPGLERPLDSRSESELLHGCALPLSWTPPSFFSPLLCPFITDLTSRAANWYPALACYLHATRYFSLSRIKWRIVPPLGDYSDSTLHASTSNLFTDARNLWDYC